MFNNLIIICSVLFLLCSCDSNKDQLENKISPDQIIEKIKLPFNAVKVDKEEAIFQLRLHVKKLIELRKNKLQVNLFDLTYYYLNPTGYSNHNKISAISSEGYWLKFENDFTYRYGSLEKEIGGGIFHYTPIEGVLLMLDDDKRLEPKFWNVKSTSEHFNFIGQPIIVIEDGEGQGQILMKNLANDGFLNAQKILVESKNGMQILMNQLDGRPVD